MCKNLDQKNVYANLQNSRTERKFFCFSQNQVNYHPHYPKGFTWHIIQTKAIKHDYYSSLIM